MLLKTLQEYAARAQPAAHVEEAGGWWLRHSPGDAWWVSAVLPHDQEDRVARAEEFCAERACGVRFQITPGVCADDLDARLHDRGYERGHAMSLQIASTAEVLRHAQATTVTVRLMRRGAYFSLSIRDDGKGFSPEALESRDAFGVMGMRERAQVLDGSLQIAREDDHTVVSLSAPLRASNGTPPGEIA